MGILEMGNINDRPLKGKHTRRYFTYVIANSAECSLSRPLVVRSISREVFGRRCRLALKEFVEVLLVNYGSTRKGAYNQRVDQ